MLLFCVVLFSCCVVVVSVCLFFPLFWKIHFTKKERLENFVSAASIAVVLSDPAPNVRTLEGFKFSCWAKGSPPIYTALIRKNTVLVNTSETASIQLDQEGNYSCVATGDQGKDTKEFSVSFTGWNFKISSPTQ